MVVVATTAPMRLPIVERLSVSEVTAWLGLVGRRKDLRRVTLV
jgi:hypothetical protein